MNSFRHGPFAITPLIEPLTVNRIRWKEENSDEWAETISKVVKFSYTWRIENFSVLLEFNDTQKSSVFPEDANQGVKWNLELTKKNSEICGSEFLSLRLKLTKWDGSTDKAKVKCYILDHEETLQQKPFIMYPNAEIIFEPFIHSGALLDKTKNLLPHDTLTIHCEIFLLTDTVCTCGKTKPIKETESKFSEDFGKLFESTKFSDVTLVTDDGQEIPAHKNILSARSEVFEEMFNNEMDKSRVVINDIDPEVLTEMLRFMYTDKAPKLNKVCRDLMAAANKYLLERLKNMCESFLYPRLTIDNAADTLILAKAHNAPQLEARTLEFINTNFDSVKSTTGWKEMSKNHSNILTEHFNTTSSPDVYMLLDKGNYRKFACEKCG